MSIRSKVFTKNKSWSAPWTSRVCDLINKLIQGFDDENFMENMIKLENMMKI